MATLSTESAKDKPFVASAAIAARYRFVTPGELQSALERFCDDIEIHDDASIAMLTACKVHHSTLKEFSRIRNYYAPHPGADPNGIAARQFMAAEAITLLLGFDHVVVPLASDVPLVNQVMIQGAEGLFQVGRPQFETLAQFCVDLVDWLQVGTILCSLNRPSAIPCRSRCYSASLKTRAYGQQSLNGVAPATIVHRTAPP
jgi:hypothetical protein